jgi:hypothetical protein
MYIKNFTEFKRIFENSNINPTRFRKASPADIVKFVDQLLYNTGNIDITEKIAGQHLTVDIKSGFVTVNTKDQLLGDQAGRDARHSRWGADITRPLIDLLQTMKLTDQTWGFEILNPRTNHDYIQYKNVDKIYIEYTGNLTEEVAEELRKKLYPGIKLLTKKDIKVNINKNEAFENFKKVWEGGLRNEFTSMTIGDDYKIGKLKDMIGDLLDEILVSVVDKVSPIEGIVIGTDTPIKLQTNKFLKIQRVQMPLYSIFKISRNEIDTVMNNPLLPFGEIQKKFGVKLDSIYRQNLRYSLYETVKYYLEQNRNLEGMDTSKYRRWLTTEESNEFLKKLTKDNVKEVYLQLYNKIKA